MFNELIEWLGAILPGYEISRGMWVDHSSIYDAFICSVQSSGGPAIDVDDRRPRYRIVLLGPRNGRQHAQAVQQAAEAICEATIEGALIPCGSAAIRAMTEPVGPGYTSENRAWVQVDLQIIY